MKMARDQTGKDMEYSFIIEHPVISKFWRQQKGQKKKTHSNLFQSCKKCSPTKKKSENPS